MDRYKFPTDPIANPKSIVQGPNYRFTVLTPNILRYEYAPDNTFEDHASTFAINRNFPTPDYSIKDHRDADGKGGVEIITEHFHVDYDGTPFSPQSLMVSFRSKITQWGGFWRYGIPDRHGDLDDMFHQGNQGGTARTLDEVNGRCDIGFGVVSRNGYAVLDDSKSMLFDGKGWVMGRKAGEGRVDGYLFVFGHEYKNAVKALYQISGQTPVVPRWALGNWWSRYYPYTQEEYLGLMDKFAERRVPLSVAVVDMDWHLVDDERVPHAGWTGYTWDEKLFPDPEKFGKELHDRKLKITLNDHPHSGVHHHETSYGEMAEFMDHDTRDKLPILFDPTSQKFMEATLNILHRNIEKQACDFWWIDWQQGAYSKIPGVDPLWVLNHYHFLDSGRDGQRPIIFSRYGGPGSHRYPVGFSGDTVTTWESLAFQPEFTASASNIGYGWWSHDIGGHMFGYRDAELVTRWVQYGVFSPIMRLHSTHSPWMSKEPWLYRPECTTVIEDFMRLRHRLIPYLYSMNIRSSRDGEPLVQPMYWDYPKIQSAYEVRNEYWFGSQLIVAPIVTPREKRTLMAKTRTWLPPDSRWIDIFTGTVYDGDRELTMYRTLSLIPVLAKEGAIIPLDAGDAPKNGGQNPDSFEILVAIGKDGEAEIIEDEADDESSKDPTKTKERISVVKLDQKGGRLTAKIASAGRSWSFRFLALGTKQEDINVSVDGADVTKDAKITATSYPQAESTLVTIPTKSTTKAGSTITLELGSDPKLAIIDHKPRIKQMIMDFEIEMAMKDRIWAIVNGPEGVGRKMGMLRGLATKLGEDVIGSFEELTIADGRNS
jgi:alpha-glucosidase (family GH31 glycosyl hydrolase)